MRFQTFEELTQARQHLIEGLWSNPSGDGLEWTRRHTELADEVLRRAYSLAIGDDGPGIAVVATGGYGRGELAPFSDVDVTVVPHDETHPRLDRTIRTLFHAIDDGFAAFGLKVGYAYRLIGDAPGLDSQTRTALLDARFVAGDPIPFERLQELFWETFPTGEFLLAKVEERLAMFRKYNDTPLVVEPQLKEGAGGLRCFQAANWIGAAMGERPARPTESYRRVLQVRNLLHAAAGRQVDLLTRTRQGEIADRTGCEIFTTSSQLARDMLELQHGYRQALERIHESRFDLVPGVRSLRGEARIERGARLGSAAAGIALATRLGLRVADLEAEADLQTPGGVAATLASGEPVLRNLDRCGLLQLILPELTHCRTLMPDDTAHKFTVFEHTLQAVRKLDSLASAEGFLGEVYHSLTSTEPLYLALLLHDVGKFDRSASHSETGARMAAGVCRRLQVNEHATDLVVWLVANHLVMARTIRMRDIRQPETVREFASLVGSPERLAMLSLLTWADISAVSDEAWTPAQQAFLHELHMLTQEALGEGEPAPLDPRVFRTQALKRLGGNQATVEEITAFVDSLPAHYLMGTSTEIIRSHFAYAKKAQQGEATIELFQRDDLQATDVTLCVRDSPGLLSRVLGVFYALDLAPIGLRACTTGGDNGVALDVFTVNFAGRPLPKATCGLLVSSLRDVLATGEVATLLRKHGKDPDRRQTIFSHTYRPGTPGILEIRAPKGRGMAYRISRVLSRAGWNIVAARVGQWAGQGAAAFYLIGEGGRQVEPEEVAKALASE